MVVIAIAQINTTLLVFGQWKASNICADPGIGTPGDINSVVPQKDEPKGLL